MNIAIASGSHWNKAALALGHTPIDIPPTTNVSAGGQPDIAARTEWGEKSLGIIDKHRPCFIIDDGALGLQFLADPDNGNQRHLLHERAAIPLFSHFMDPVISALSKFPLDTLFSLLASVRWIKLIWDSAEARELQSFHVPGCAHLPLAANDLPYDTTPLSMTAVGPAISFVGSQTGTFFRGDGAFPTGRMVAGIMAMGAKFEHDSLTFGEIYHDYLRLAERPRAEEPVAERAKKYFDFLNAKFFYTAARMLAQRERFILYLHAQFPQEFVLHGNGWENAYKLPARPQFATYESYLQHFREAAININLVAGHTQCGVNLRTFEIPAAGGFMLHQERPELAQYFVPGVECATFSNEKELGEKCRHYLARPAERCAIAAAGQRRALKNHLFSHRLQTIIQVAEKL